MDFGFTPEERIWKKTVEDFVEKEASAEHVLQWEKEGQYPYALYDKVVKQGWMGVLFPERYGGGGSNFWMFAIFIEAISKHGYDFQTMFGMPIFTALYIAAHGTEEQKRCYLPRFLTGGVRFSIGLSEPEAGSDVFSMVTSAVADGEYFVINGQKIFQTGAHLKDNIIVLAARTRTAGPKHQRISLFLVPNDMPGVEIHLLPLVVRRIVATSQIFLTDVRVPRQNLIGEMDKGWEYITEDLDMERTSAAAGCVGPSQTVVNYAVTYAKQRIQFGRPIARFQAISHMLADMQLEVDAARLLTYRAASMITQGLPCRKESAMAKLWASETYSRVTANAMQTLGAYSFLPESHVERHWREARATTVSGGTSQIQREVIKRALGV